MGWLDGLSMSLGCCKGFRYRLVSNVKLVQLGYAKRGVDYRRVCWAEVQ